MSKVEELQDEVVTYCDPWQRDSAIRVLDSLIAAAREEGAEQERERIREGSQMVGVEKDGVTFIGGVDYVGSAFLVPVDVLSPAPKEDK